MRALVLGAAILALSACSGDAPGDGAQEDAASTMPDPRPVRVGLSGPELDACAGLGVISGVPESGQPVHAAPSSDAAETGVLLNEQEVTICEIAGGWIGVVYEDATDEDKDCETSSPVDSEQDYAGPCKSGWIRDRSVEFVAG